MDLEEAGRAVGGRGLRYSATPVVGTTLGAGTPAGPSPGVAEYRRPPPPGTHTPARRIDRPREPMAVACLASSGMLRLSLEECENIPGRRPSFGARFRPSLRASSPLAAGHPESDTSPRQPPGVPFTCWASSAT